MSRSQQRDMGRVHHIHFVGIGGAGMCGIAEILNNLGYRISGSDLRESPVTRHLQELNIKVSYGHSADNIQDADVVVVSSAVDETNPEVTMSRQRRIPVIPRAEMLAEIMRFRHGIAIAGTHGKTTTTSLIASLLGEAGMDPTFVIGGQLNSIGRNAKLGSGKYLVAEADESDASFMHLQPVIAVLTNIDADHLETYNGNYDCLSDTFLEFLQRLPFYGLAVMCVDDSGVRGIVEHMTKPYVTYGIDQVADYRATDLKFKGSISSFKVHRPEGRAPLEIRLNLPGRHNVLNSLAAVAVASELGVTDMAIIACLEKFEGIARRCNVLGKVSIAGKSVTLIDDYAHHPSEIDAILDAIREGWPENRAVVIFQPHRYSRTRDLFDEFCEVLSAIENLLLIDVYPAGEQPVPGADSATLRNEIAIRAGRKPILIEHRSEVVEHLQGLVKDGDILLILGAGDIGLLGHELLKQFGNEFAEGMRA